MMHRYQSVETSKPSNVNKYFATLVAFWWLYMGIGNYFVEIIRRLFGQNMGSILVDLALIVVYVYLVLTARNYVGSRIHYRHVIFVLAYLMVILISCILYPQNREMIWDYLPTALTVCIPMLFLGSCIEPDRELLSLLAKCSAIVIAVNVAYYFYFLWSGRLWANDNMTFASVNLPSFMMLIGWFTLNRKKKMSIALAVIAFIFTLMLGSRGGMVCVVIFTALLILKLVPGKKAIILTLLFCILVTLLLTGVLDSAVVFFARTISSLRGSDRVVEMLLSGEFFKDSARGALVAVSWKYGCLEHPIIGMGIFGDRIVTGQHGGLLAMNVSTYTHNILIELLCSFGFFVGGAIFLTLVSKMTRLYLRECDGYRIVFFCILITLGFAKLFMSGTFLTSDFFFLLVGFLISDVPHGKRLITY